MKDCREEWYDKDAKVAVTIVDVTSAAQELARGHLAGPTAAHYLTEALAEVALLGAEMSEKDETVILQAKCTGPLGGYNVECTAQGTLRGYTEKKILDGFDGLGRPKDRMVLGDQQIQVTRSVPGKILSQGISTSLDGYFAGSLQRNACLKVEAAVSDEVEILEARGLMVEALPDSGLGSVGSIGSLGSVGSIGSIGSLGSLGSVGSIGPLGSIGSVGSIGSLGSGGSVGSLGSVGSVGSIGTETVIDPTNPKDSKDTRDPKDPISPRTRQEPIRLAVTSRNILKQLGLEKAELRKTTPLKFACRCSADRAVAMLAALSAEERAGLPPTIDITCHMCGKTFTVKV